MGNCCGSLRRASTYVPTPRIWVAVTYAVQCVTDPNPVHIARTGVEARLLDIGPIAILAVECLPWWPDNRREAPP